MKARIYAPSGFYNYDKAIKIAEELNASDDWEYKVVDCENGYGRIDVYDEEGHLVHEGFFI